VAVTHAGNVYLPLCIDVISIDIGEKCVQGKSFIAECMIPPTKAIRIGRSHNHAVVVVYDPVSVDIPPPHIAGTYSNVVLLLRHFPVVLINTFHVEQKVRADLLTNLQSTVSTDAYWLVIAYKGRNFIFVGSNIELG